MRRPFVFAILTASLAAGSANFHTARADDGDDAAAYKLANGTHKIRTVNNLVLRDEKREKDLQLRVNHPDGDGPFPVIVWSHGAFGSNENYRPLVEHWASHGYVTIQPNHSDSRALGTRPGDPAGFRDWPSRPVDVSFIIDSLGELEKIEPALNGKLDAKRIGVGGHSFGANTAQFVGGAKAFPLGGEKSFEDQRVAAVMLLSGQGPGEMLTDKSWEKFAKPMLVMSGSADGPTRTGQPAEWRKKPFELSPPGDKYLVWVEGLDHGYGGITGSANPRLKPNEAHIKYTKIVTLAFWDTHLKESQEARAYLHSEKLTAFSQKTLKLERK
jgi:predicted dienelactone hydrolase